MKKAKGNSFRDKIRDKKNTRKIGRTIFSPSPLATLQTDVRSPFASPSFILLLRSLWLSYRTSMIYPRLASGSKARRAFTGDTAGIRTVNEERWKLDRVLVSCLPSLSLFLSPSSSLFLRHTVVLSFAVFLSLSPGRLRYRLRGQRNSSFASLSLSRSFSLVRSFLRSRRANVLLLFPFRRVCRFLERILRFVDKKI